MYVRDARKREEVWLLDQIEAIGLDDAAFRSRDYVIAIDEDSDEKAGLGRVRVHKTDGRSDVCELTGIGVLPAWRAQGVGAHVIERLIRKAGDSGFEVVYSFTTEPGYLGQFDFEPVGESDLPAPLADRLATVRENSEKTVIPMGVRIEGFSVPGRLREAFKQARPQDDPSTDEPDATPEDFGIDPDSATYKYDTG